MGRWLLAVQEAAVMGDDVHGSSSAAAGQAKRLLPGYAKLQAVAGTHPALAPLVQILEAR